MYRVLLAGLLAVAAWAQPYADYGDQQLAAYIAEAVDKNPAVRASFARYRASLQKIPQVTALPDPMLNLTPFIRSPETRVGPQRQKFGVMQMSPWFGKLRLRGDAAGHGGRVAVDGARGDGVHQARDLRGRPDHGRRQGYVGRLQSRRAPPADHCPRSRRPRRSRARRGTR